MNALHHRRIRAKVRRQRFGNRTFAVNTYLRALGLTAMAAGRLAATLTQMRALIVARAMERMRKEADYAVGGELIPGPSFLVGERGPEAWVAIKPKVADGPGLTITITSTPWRIVPEGIAPKIAVDPGAGCGPDPLDSDSPEFKRFHQRLIEDQRARDERLIMGVFDG